MRISDWSSDVCSSDLIGGGHLGNGRDFWRGEPGLQRSRDPARDLAFDAEDVVQGALVALGPEMMVGPRIDQLHRNQDVVADLLHAAFDDVRHAQFLRDLLQVVRVACVLLGRGARDYLQVTDPGQPRSEEHTSELQSLMRISYAVFGLNKKTNK